MGRGTYGDPSDVIQPEMIRHVRGDRDVASVGWVERPPEKPDARSPRLRQDADGSKRSSAASAEFGYSPSKRLRASAARSSYPIASLPR
jgi:hypothetical protein